MRYTDWSWKASPVFSKKVELLSLESGVDYLESAEIDWAKGELCQDLDRGYLERERMGLQYPDPPELQEQEHPTKQLTSRIWLMNLHAHGLKQIAAKTECSELKDLLHELEAIPPIAPEPL